MCCYVYKSEPQKGISRFPVSATMTVAMTQLSQKTFYRHRWAMIDPFRIEGPAVISLR